MKFNHFNSNREDSLMSIDDLRASRLLNQKIESDKKARKYILEINQRYRKMNANKNYKFFKNMNPFRKIA